jgi:hypothetical protein
MSGFTLSYYLEDLRRVEALSFSQLNALVAKYPYCQLLRGLLTRKSEEFAINEAFKSQKLTTLGLFNGRIGKLFDLVYRTFQKVEEKPEITEVEEVVLQQVPTIKEPIVSKLAVAQLKVEHKQADVEKEPAIPIGKRMRKMLSKFNQNPSRVSDNEFLPEEMASFDLTSDETAGAQTDSYSSAEYLASNFVQWLKSFKKPLVKTEEIPTIERSTRNIITPITATPDAKPLKAKSMKKKKKAKKKKKNKKKAGGLLINEEIYSETLAELLADQGHNSKAIKMYQQLSLIFPEKSALFAVKIEKIKRKSE